METTNTLHVTNRDDRRSWLSEYHTIEKEIWLVYYTVASGEPRLPYLEVEEALCFGWVDGIGKKTLNVQPKGPPRLGAVGARRTAHPFAHGASAFC